MNSVLPSDQRFMMVAIEQAREALRRGDRPIGAVIVYKGQIVSKASNTFLTTQSNLAHAELNALLQASSFLRQFGHQCTIYTTCEPCLMCLGAIVMANIREIVFGMPDNYIRGRLAIDAIPYVRHRINRYVGGILQEECIELFQEFSREETELCLWGPKPRSTAES